MFDSFTEHVARWLAHRRTAGALQTLSPRELADIGLSRNPTAEFNVPLYGHFGNASYEHLVTYAGVPRETGAQLVIEAEIVAHPVPAPAAAKSPVRPRRRTASARKVVGAGA